MKKLFNFRGAIYLTLIVTIIAFLQSCAVSKPDTAQIVTVPDIIQMSKDGIPSRDIIRDIKKSHTVYSLKADQLANLRDEGVQDSVLNYMEETKIKAIRQDQRYADASYWWMAPDGFFYGAFGWGWPYGYYGWGMGPAIIYNVNRGYYGGYHGGYIGGGNHGGYRR